MLGIEDSMVQRYVNQGFSGGEKKKNEVLQLAVLEPADRASSTRPTRGSTSTR